MSGNPGTGQEGCIVQVTFPRVSYLYHGLGLGNARIQMAMIWGYDNAGNSPQGLLPRPGSRPRNRPRTALVVPRFLSASREYGISEIRALQVTGRTKNGRELFFQSPSNIPSRVASSSILHHPNNSENSRSSANGLVETRGCLSVIEVVFGFIRRDVENRYQA